MRRLAWIVTVPVTLVVVIFAVANRQAVTIDLWPLEMVYSLPLFALVLFCLLLGFICGAVVMWLSAGKTRSRARQSRHRASSLEREVSDLKRRRPDSSPEPGGSARLPANSARR